jgi:hypothetical protein
MTRVRAPRRKPAAEETVVVADAKKFIFILKF